MVGEDAAVRSVTEVAGPIFEAEARDVLLGGMREMCPWLEGSPELWSRMLDYDGDGRQADVFGYVNESGPAVSTLG